MAARGHWEDVYAGKPEMALSWYQAHAVQSLELIDAAATDHSASVIDVGGGASTLVDDLLARGFGDLTVLDIAERVLGLAKARLGPNADKVAWIAADITRWTPARTWDIWHDRAVFHFLTERLQQDAYIAALGAGTRAGATAIIATLEGPEKCSGLYVQRYSPETLATRLGTGFRLTGQVGDIHKTPWGAEQAFWYSMFKRQ